MTSRVRARSARSGTRCAAPALPADTVQADVVDSGGSARRRRDRLADALHALQVSIGDQIASGCAPAALADGAVAIDVGADIRVAAIPLDSPAADPDSDGQWMVIVGKDGGAPDCVFVGDWLIDLIESALTATPEWDTPAGRAARAADAREATPVRDERTAPPLSPTRRRTLSGVYTGCGATWMVGLVSDRTINATRCTGN